MDPATKSLKRLGRYIVAYGIAGGIKYLVELAPTIELGPVFQPVLTAGIAAIGKWIRETWNIRVPF